MEWVTSKRHMTAEHRLARAVQTLQADAHTSPASSRLNWPPHRFKWTRPLRRKTKSGFCACAITFQTQSTDNKPAVVCCVGPEVPMAVNINTTVFWYVTPCSLLGRYQSFGRICCFHLQGKKNSKDGNKSFFSETWSVWEEHGVTSRTIRWNTLSVGFQQSDICFKWW
jgi:hypothetical protein